MNKYPQTLMNGVDPSDPDNWRLTSYEKREGYAAIRKILAKKIHYANVVLQLAIYQFRN